MTINQLPVELLQRIFTLYIKGLSNGRVCASHGDHHRSTRLVNPDEEEEEMEFAEGMAGENEEEEPRLFHPQPSKRNTPIHLSVVCRHWRSIMLSMPEMWAFVDVRAPLGPRDVPIYEAWFARSGEELLDLSVCDSEVVQDRDDSGRAGGLGHAYASSSTSSSSREESMDALFAILQRAMSVCHRWKQVCLAIQEHDAGRMVVAHSSRFSDSEDASAPSGSATPIAPNLESFDITLKETGAASFAGSTRGNSAIGGGSGPVSLPPSLSSPIIHILCRALCMSPKLTGALWGAYVDQEMMRYIPFNRLQRLGVEFISDRDAKEVLSACRELREVKVGRYGPPPVPMGGLHSPPGFNQQQQQPQQHAVQTGNGNVGVITLLKLEVATLNFKDEFPAPPTFFTSFLTPSLEELNLPYGFGIGLAPDEGWKALARFLGRSGCTLSTFRFCDAVRMTACEESTMRRFLDSRVFRELRECSVGHGRRGIVTAGREGGVGAWR